MQKKRIYIAGKISGLLEAEVESKFRTSEITLQALGFDTVNPVEHCRRCGLTDENEWIDFMECCLHVLVECDGIYLQSDWKDSKGAQLECLFAQTIQRYNPVFKIYDSSSF